MKFAEAETQDRRRVLLRGLQAASQYRANGLLLRHYAEAVGGHAASADRIAGDLAWLGEQGLVELEQLQGVDVATLTERGLDVATGRATVPGVARPQPGY